VYDHMQSHGSSKFGGKLEIALSSEDE
jgi:hypothetical protein